MQNVLKPMHDVHNKSKNASEEYHSHHAKSGFDGRGAGKGPWWADVDTPFENAPTGIK